MTHKTKPRVRKPKELTMYRQRIADLADDVDYLSVRGWEMDAPEARRLAAWLVKAATYLDSKKGKRK